MIHLTRTIEYQYDDLLDMAGDVACWTLRPSSSGWFPFGPRKQARSRIVKVFDTEAAPAAAGGPSTPSDPSVSISALAEAMRGVSLEQIAGVIVATCPDAVAILIDRDGMLRAASEPDSGRLS